MKMRYSDIESNTVELKREFPRNTQILKTVVAFCNTYGGKIIIGVADDGEVVGVSEIDLEESMSSLEQSIFDNCAPTIIPRIYVQRFESKALIVIEISEGMNKPYYLRSEGIERGTFIRLNKHTMQAKEDTIKELSWNARGIDYELLPVYKATMSDLDQNAILQFLKYRKNQGGVKLEEQVLKSYGIIAYDQNKKYPSVLGTLLFAHNPQQFISEAIVICTHFRGIDGREAIAQVDCEGSLFNQYEQAYAFILSRLYKSFTIQGSKRHEQLEIPEIAIREALLNLIVHRNYHLRSPSKIAIYDDRVEFFSPGQVPGQFDVSNLLSGISYLRNPAICKIFREANYIEKLGSGFITIFTTCKKYGLKSPVVIDGGTFVKCILFREHEEVEVAGKDSDVAKIIRLFESREEYTANQIAQFLGVSHTTVVRRLNTMLKLGTIVKLGERRSTRYKRK
jgi:ATP-dependent DNA helicase RecG